jgi:hypothetical protein
MQEVTVVVKMKFEDSFPEMEVSAIRDNVLYTLCKREQSAGIKGTNHMKEITVEIPNCKHGYSNSYNEDEIRHL